MTFRSAVALSLLAGLAATAARADDFTLTSTSFPEGVFTEDQILSAPYGFGCDGHNIAPALNWSGAPEGTQSFVLRMHDPDAPTGIGWTHWVVVNIPGNATSIGAGSQLPEGAMETRTDFAVPGYGGACPPEGTEHRYVFTLDALAIPALPEMVTADTMPAFVGFLAGANSLGQASLTVTYGR